MYAKVDCFKGDCDNNQYPLRDCEITLYTLNNDVYTIAKDLNGNDCVGTTDNNGRLTFNVQDTNFDTGGSIKYFAKETRAPFGYKLLDGYWSVRPTPLQNDAISTPMSLLMFDKIIIVPPKFGGWNEALLNPYTGNPLAEIWWQSSYGPGYFDDIHWYYFYSGYAWTESNTYLPGHIIHPSPDASALITDVDLTFIDEHDKVTRTIKAGSAVGLEYRAIFHL